MALSPPAGHDVRSAVVQQQHAARLAGLPPPSLLACADAVCTQAEAAASQAEQHPASQASTSQQALPATELNSDDVAELGRVVGLLRRLRRELGRQPLPEAVRLALRESGLADYLCERAAGAAVEAGGSQAEAQLPAPLPAVLLRAQRVMEEWRAQQQQQQQEPREEPPDEDDWLGGGAPESGAAGAGRQDEGEALVLELLSQLAQDPAEEGGNMSQQQQSAADSDGEGGGGGSGPGVLTLSTIHSAKGLEWPVVFMPGVCEGVLPLRFRPPRDFFAGSDAGDARLAGSRLQHLEEERRLFHVAATRARDALHVSYVQPAAGGPCQGEGHHLLKYTTGCALRPCKPTTLTVPTARHFVARNHSHSAACGWSATPCGLHPYVRAAACRKGGGVGSSPRASLRPRRPAALFQHPGRRTGAPARAARRGAAGGAAASGRLPGAVLLGGQGERGAGRSPGGCLQRLHRRPTTAAAGPGRAASTAEPGRAVQAQDGCQAAGRARQRQEGKAGTPAGTSGSTALGVTQPARPNAFLFVSCNQSGAQGDR
jgi:hypothetical protein